MRFALDKYGNRVCINQTFIKEEYFCPLCGEKLVLKKGNIRVHHFAHQSNSQCNDFWHYDMSEWHIRWQNRFPLETQEIVLTKDDCKHRADVLLEKEKVIYEFQHYSLSAEEFDERNKFYNSLGYRVIWIFDLTSQYENESLNNYRGYLFKWKKPFKTFNNFVFKDNPNVEIYFQLQYSAEENDKVAVVKKRLDDGLEFYGDEEYYQEHKDDEIELVKVRWATDNGFEIFAIDGYVYNEEDIVNEFINKEKKNEPVQFGTLFDSLIELYKKDHTTYYFGCPRSSTHICGSTSIDIPDSKFEEIYPCSLCEYSERDKNSNFICKKRFLDLGLYKNTQVKIISKSTFGFISQIEYEDNKDWKVINLPVFSSPMIDTILILWNENKYKKAIFKNIRTGKFIKIVKNPIDQITKYKKVYGYLSNTPHSFKGESLELYGYDKPEWFCVWNVK